MNPCKFVFSEFNIHFINVYLISLQEYKSTKKYYKFIDIIQEWMNKNILKTLGNYSTQTNCNEKNIS